MLNQCQFIGRLGRDPETRRLQNGSLVVNLRLAVSERWRDKATGEKKEKTEWVSVVVFNEKIAAFTDQYLKKGALIFVSGQLQTREWQDKDGAKRYSTEIVLQNFRGELTILDGGKTDGESSDDGEGSGSHGHGSSGGGGGGTQRENSYAKATGKAEGRRVASDMDDEIPF